MDQRSIPVFQISRSLSRGRTVFRLFPTAFCILGISDSCLFCTVIDTKNALRTTKGPMYWIADILLGLVTWVFMMFYQLGFTGQILCVLNVWTSVGKRHGALLNKFYASSSVWQSAESFTGGFPCKLSTRTGRLEWFPPFWQRRPLYIVIVLMDKIQAAGWDA